MSISSRSKITGILSVTSILLILYWACIVQAYVPSEHRFPRREAYHRQESKISRDDKANTVSSSSADRDLSWRETIKLGPAHQNPGEAPPVAIPVPASLGSMVSEPVSPVPRDLLSFAKRDGGPLYCKDAPCVDDSCCGKDGICGYGPDYCGDGCSSNCDALAMCGEYSEDADMPCGMKLCCSATGWCGTTEVYCNNADPIHGTLPCQAGYGSCSITGPPSCSPSSGSSLKRTIGYYQSWNVRDRLCNKVSPKQLDTTGYTHLFYSFAFIDPNTFEIVPAHPDDDAMMREFTDLSKDGKLQTWIAIGGFDFSNEDTATHTTWSDMVSTKANRAAFIKSVEHYMLDYGFQGVDIDWEYPGDPKRGGRKLQDTRNLATLVREMRAAYNDRFGISLTLAPDYWYLRWFDAKAMESSVDFFGFMAYDLHGSWDADVKALGKKVRGQADIREIRNNTLPLWFDGLNPAKINFGLAMYGRGYTLKDPTCNQLLCPFEGPSEPAPCTGFGGVMSLQEIQQLIAERNIVPQYLPESMMKQITWDDQWIGYDDEETFAAKREFANSMCFGGTMIWSIDFQFKGSGGPEGDVVYLGPKVYSEEPAQCTPPCLMVFPPSALLTPTTIAPPPYTMSIEVGVQVIVTKTITLTVQPLTLTEMPYQNYQVTRNQTDAITLLPSVDFPPQNVVVTGPDSRTTTRTVTPAPWPRILSGSPPNGVPTGSPTETSTSTSTDTIPISWEWPPEVTGTTVDDDTIPDMLTPIPPPGASITWPAGSIGPVLDDDEPEDKKKKSQSCKSWFFVVCISWGKLDIKFWSFDFPSGTTIGPGPPPPGALKLPEGWNIIGKLKFPEIKIGVDGIPTPPPQPPGCTPTQTATLAITTLSYKYTVSNSITRTTATETISTQFPILGCDPADSTKTVSQSACSRPTKARRALPQPTTLQASKPSRTVDFYDLVDPFWTPPALARRDDDSDCEDEKSYEIVVIPKDPKNVDEFRLELQINRDLTSSYKEIRSPTLGFTAFFYLSGVFQDGIDELRADWPEYIDSLIRVSDYSKVSEWGAGCKKPDNWPDRRSEEPVHDIEYEGDMTSTNPGISARADPGRKTFWHLSQLSVPPGVDWADSSNGYVQNLLQQDMSGRYASDPSSCEGQYIYISDSAVNWAHEDLKSVNHETLSAFKWGTWDHLVEAEWIHGTAVASIAAGDMSGVCRKATVVDVANKHKLINCPAREKHPLLAYWSISDLLMIAEDIARNKRGPKSVINMSWGGSPDVSSSYTRVLRALLIELDKLGTVLVAAAGNDAIQSPGIMRAPALLATNGVPNIIVVGAATIDSRRAAFSQFGDSVTVYGQGHNVRVADGLANSGYVRQFGTSFAAPQVAGLVAYFRGLPGQGADDLADPSDVKMVVRKLRRPVKFARNLDPGSLPMPFPPQLPQGKELVYTAWNGQVGDASCLLDVSAPGCPEIDFTDDTPVGDLDCYQSSSKRRSVDSCPLPPNKPDGSPGSPGGGGGNNGGGGSNDPRVPTKIISFQSGPPAPTCGSGDRCGVLCKEGYWCKAHPLGFPPDFHDPAGQTTRPTGGTPGTSTSVPAGTKTSTFIEPTGPAITDAPPLGTTGLSWTATSPSGGVCVSSSTATLIGGPGGGGGGQQVTRLESGCVSYTVPAAQPTSNPWKPSFYVYTTFENGYDPTGGGAGQDIYDFALYNGSPSCKDVLNGKSLSSTTDASKPNYVARCVGCAWYGGSTPNPSVFEFHTPSVWATWYADRDGALVNTDDVRGGECRVDTSHKFECVGITSPIWGVRQLACMSSINADDIMKLP